MFPGDQKCRLHAYHDPRRWPRLRSGNLFILVHINTMLGNVRKTQHCTFYVMGFKYIQRYLFGFSNRFNRRAGLMPRRERCR